MKKILSYLFIIVLVSQCVAKKSQNKQTVLVDEIEHPAPIDVSSAKVQLQLTEHKANSIMVIIKKTYEYGMSTKRLAPNQTLIIYVDESLKEKVSLMKQDFVFDAVLSMQPAGINIPETWKLIKILNLE